MASQRDAPGPPALRGPSELLQAQELLQRSRQRVSVQAQVLALAQRGPEERLQVLVAAQERRRVLQQPELPGE